MSAGLEVFVTARAEVGEGPVLDQRSGRVVWVDIPEGKVFESDPDGATRTLMAAPLSVGAVAPREHTNGFAVACADGFGILEHSELTISDRVLPSPEYRMNDAKVDSRGRLWAGSTHINFIPGLGRLHRWDGVAASTVMASGFTLPNGIGWSPDDSTMYLADSFAHVLLCADFDADEGTISPFRVLAEVPDGLPDGLSVDTEGHIWLAIWGAGEVRRIDPQGKVVQTVELPVSQPSSCAFLPSGHLAITSARAGLSHSQIEQEPLAGSVFMLPTEFRGVPVTPFRA